MKQAQTIFLQTIIIIIAIITMSIMIKFPLTEGRAQNLDLFSIYFNPFILYGYLSSIAFFVALLKTFNLLRYIRENKVFSIDSIKALKSIKYCTILLSILIMMAGIYISIFHDKKDDPAGFIAICTLTTFIFIIVTITTSIFEKICQSGLNIKLETNKI
ncbi:MAG: DUF2975 domain-containing protein [Candidatus Sericytochromatia bacterium]